MWSSVLLLLLPCWSVWTSVRAEIDCSRANTTEELAYCRCPFRHSDPCECTLLRDQQDRVVNYTVACYGADAEQFPAMMDKLRAASLPVHTLFLNRCNVTLPKVDVFRFLPFVAVHFVWSRLDPPNQKSSDSYLPILGGLEKSVTEVYFRGSQVVGVDSDSRPCALGSLTELRRLSIAGAGLTQITEGFFCCSYLSLEEIYLYDNDIQAMKRGAMSRAERLRIFNANRNRISVVDRQFFHGPANSLEEIHLRYNEIQGLPSDMFADMPNLRVVDLAHNKIQFLPENIWSSVWTNLQDIYLDGNDLSCECNLDWLALKEPTLDLKTKRERFLTGQCTSPKYSNSTTQLDNLDITDIVCP